MEFITVKLHKNQKQTKKKNVLLKKKYDLNNRENIDINPQIKNSMPMYK